MTLNGWNGFWPIAILAPLALSGCIASLEPRNPVELEVAGPPIDAAQTGQPFLYAIPTATGGSDGGLVAQTWSMLGREDLGAAGGSTEYAPAECAPVAGSSPGWNEVVDAIAARAANRRIVIVNESHAITRHRETMRLLLRRLRPLGFSHFAVEAFTNAAGVAPVNEHASLPWPHQGDGFYTREPVFGRLIREAKALHYRLVPYEQVQDASTPSARERIESREAEQANHLAAIFQALQPQERLIVYVGYSHARETPDVRSDGRPIEWMAARLRSLTGVDPLTVAQTICRQEAGEAVLVMPPPGMPAGSFDMIVSHPIESFVSNRPSWRRQEGDIPTAIPPSLRPVTQPLVIEAFRWGEPFNAVPVDRVYVEPGENLPLLLPPGRYRVRAVRATRS